MAERQERTRKNGKANGTGGEGRIFLVSPFAVSARGAQAGVWNVVVETPRGSPHKYKFEPELGSFTLHRVLPDGMRFPYDFGFLPGTCAEDGDPLDVLVLTEQPTFCGCVVPARFIGTLQARQTERGKTIENDRLIAVPAITRETSEIRTLRDLPRKRLEQITRFFENYDREFGKTFRARGIRGPREAVRAAREALQG